MVTLIGNAGANTLYDGRPREPGTEALMGDELQTAAEV